MGRKLGLSHWEEELRISKQGRYVGRGMWNAGVYERSKQNFDDEA